MKRNAHPNCQFPVNAAESKELARIYSTQISDTAIQLAFCVGDERWGAASEHCLRANEALQRLAGAVSKLLPVGHKTEEVT